MNTTDIYSLEDDARALLAKVHEFERKFAKETTIPAGYRDIYGTLACNLGAVSIAAGRISDKINAKREI